jgi:hypothetical protein
MKTEITPDAVYAVSDGIVSREIENEIILIPCAFPTNDTENEPYILNTTGQIIWQKLDGIKSLNDIVAELTAEFKTPAKEIEKDVKEFVKKLLKKKLLVKVSGT